MTRQKYSQRIGLTYAQGSFKGTSGDIGCCPCVFSDGDFLLVSMINLVFVPELSHFPGFLEAWAAEHASIALRIIDPIISIPRPKIRLVRVCHGNAEPLMLA